jgi:hypothetical protein
MAWLRRVVGIVLSSVLLLMMALPSICGNCQATAAKANCAEDHGGKTKGPGGSSGYADCDHCGGSQGISPSRQIYQSGPESVVLSDIAKTPRLDSHRIVTVFAATGPVMHVHAALQKKYIVLGKISVPNSRYHPLTVSLKI